MNNRQKQIGFNQHIRFKWLQYTVNLVLVGHDNGAVNSLLQELLQDKVSVDGRVVCGIREKVITILMKIWLNVPGEFKILRDDSLELLKDLSPKNYTALRDYGTVVRFQPFLPSNCIVLPIYKRKTEDVS